MNKIIKQAAKYILIYSVTLSFFIILLTLVSSFHSTWIYDNVKKSAETLLQETNCKEVNVNFKGTKIYIDNHTDALMINTAYSIDNRQPLYSAFVARKNFLPDKTEIIYPDSVGELDFSKKYKKLSQTSELNDIVNGEVLESFEYARYWHGYLTILRPLLIIFDVNSIRMLFRAVFVILAIWLLYLINKKINLKLNKK